MKTCVFSLFPIVFCTWKIALTNNGNVKYKDIEQISEEEDFPTYSVSITSSVATTSAIHVRATTSNSGKGLLETST
jgi:hypothetical protein